MNMPIKIVNDNEFNPLNNSDEGKIKMKIYCNDAIENFVNSGVQSLRSA